MKDLSEIYVSETSLKMITRTEIQFQFPILKTKNKKDRKEKVSLQYILDSESKDAYGKPTIDHIANVRSFDTRFDKKHPLQLALDYIKDNGIRKDILAKIYMDEKCVKEGRMVGPYAIFNELLTSDQKEVIEKRLIWEQEQKEQRKKNLDNWCK